jgi:AraC-like DNA-binding protein
MMGLTEIDLLARGGAIALILLWSWLLLRDNWHALAARVAVAMNVAIICYIVPRHRLAIIPLSQAEPGQALSIVVDAASVLSPALFWLFAHVWFTDARRISRRVAAIVLAFSILPVAQLLFIQMSGDYSRVIWLVVRVGMVGFGLAGMWIAWRGRDNDLVEPRRRFRSTIIWIIGGFVIWVSLIEIPVRRGLWYSSVIAMTEVAIVLTTFFVTAALYRFNQPYLFDASPAPMRPPGEGNAAADPSPLARQLRAHMLHERAYRADGLTIAALAGQLGEQEYRLRRLINGELGYRNFAAFLNGYRLAEVKEALADPAQADVPIITIALDAGFGSLGPFNRAFREAEGVTPSQYRQQKLADSGIG